MLRRSHVHRYVVIHVLMCFSFGGHFSVRYCCSASDVPFAFFALQSFSKSAFWNSFGRAAGIRSDFETIPVSRSRVLFFDKLSLLFSFVCLLRIHFERTAAKAQYGRRKIKEAPSHLTARVEHHHHPAKPKMEFYTKMLGEKNPMFHVFFFFFSTVLITAKKQRVAHTLFKCIGTVEWHSL